MSATNPTINTTDVAQFNNAIDESLRFVELPPHPYQAASNYVLSVFEPDDLIAVMLLRDRKCIHRFERASDVASTKFMDWLREQNDAGFNVFVSMNPLSAERRVKEHISGIRTVYLDLDHNGEAALEKLRKSTIVPKPHFVLQSSPQKFQVIWRVQGIAVAEQERLLDALIREFDGDPAASDSTRVLRLPSFVNHKYDSKPVVELIETDFDAPPYRRADFRIQSATPSKRAEVIPAVIADGSRNKTMASLAGSMRRRGASKDAILAALRETNKCCKPPLDDSELDLIARSISKYEPAEDPNTEPPINEEPLPEFPAITGSIAELADALCPDIPREFKIMAAITRVGLALSGKIHLKDEPHLQPRFYTCFIAEAGRGKTAAIKETRIAHFDSREIPSVDSAPALVDAFAEQNATPRRILLSPDEAVDLFEKAKTSRDSRNSLFTELLKLYEDNVTGNRARRNETQIEIHDAHLAILCGATPSGYDAMWTGSRGASGGLQSRFVPIVTTALPIPAMQRPSDVARVETAIERIRQQVNIDSPTLLTMTADAEDSFKQWWESVPKEKPSAVRVEALVKRFLMVLAVTNDVDVIGTDLIAAGIAFGTYIIAVRERFNPADSASWVQAFENRIVACHEKQGVPITRDHCRKLVHPDRYAGGFGDFVKAHDNLVRAGRLSVQGKTERASKFGLS